MRKDFEAHISKENDAVAKRSKVTESGRGDLMRSVNDAYQTTSRSTNHSSVSNLQNVVSTEAPRRASLRARRSTDSSQTHGVRTPDS